MNTTSAVFKPIGGRALVLVRLYCIGAILGAFVLPLLGSLVTAVTGDPPTETLSPRLLLIALLLAPVTEEFAFRWLPFFLIEQRPRVAIFAGALAFGAMHWVVHPASGAVAFASGLLLGWIYSRSRVIWDSVAMHSGINAGAIALAAMFGSEVA